MKTTLTIDDKLAKRLQDRMRATGASFSETVETVLALGLEKEAPAKRSYTFKVKARPMILREGVELTSADDGEEARFLRVNEQNMKEL